MQIMCRWRHKCASLDIVQAVGLMDKPSLP